MSLYLCLDQGGHASRALALDERGAVVARAVCEVPTVYPAPDRVEQDADAVVKSLLDVSHEVMSSLGQRASEVASVGLATQRSSIVCWDRETGQSLSPVISWQDRRAHAWLRQFDAHANEIEQLTGLRLSPHYGASKMRWCLDNLPSVRAAQLAGQLAIGPLASFLAFRMLAEHPFVIDPSNAQRTLLWNLKTRNWDLHLCELFGVPHTLLPECTPTRHAFGQLQLGGRAVSARIIIGDQAAAIFASGLPGKDVAYLNLGTGAFAQCILHKPDVVSGLLTGMALQDGDTEIYTLEGTVNGAGAALAWAAQTLNLSDLESRLADWLSREDDPPLFMNGIGGLGAPYWIADYPSRFVGNGESWQKAVAVAESILFLIAINIERMQTQVTLRSLFVSGGLAALDALCQRLADLIGLDVWRPDEHEATARGLAWLLAKCPKEWNVTGGDRFSPAPNPALQRRYMNWRTEISRSVR